MSDNDKESPIEYYNMRIRMSKKMYDMICECNDIRELVRELNKAMDAKETEDNVRMQASLYLIMFDRYPLGYTEEEIYQLLEEEKYWQYPDEDFSVLTKLLIERKAN